MWHAEWDSAPPSDRLLQAGSENGKLLKVFYGRHPVTAHLVNLCLRLVLPLRVQSHGHLEELERARDGDDADEVEEADHARGKGLVLFGLVECVFLFVCLLLSCCERGLLGVLDIWTWSSGGGRHRGRRILHHLLKIPIRPRIAWEFTLPHSLFSLSKQAQPPLPQLCLSLDFVLVPWVNAGRQGPQRRHSVGNRS